MPTPKPSKWNDLDHMSSFIGSRVVIGGSHTADGWATLLAVTKVNDVVRVGVLYPDSRTVWCPSIAIFSIERELLATDS